VLNGKQITAVLPAHNAGETLKRTVDELDRAVVDDVWLVDDASTDDTTEQAERLGLCRFDTTRTGVTARTRRAVTRQRAIPAPTSSSCSNPDHRCSPLLVPALAARIAHGEHDLVLGSRIDGPVEAVDAGGVDLGRAGRRIRVGPVLAEDRRTAVRGAGGLGAGNQAERDPAPAAAAEGMRARRG
jgi:glycosyltransferase involved in cell wall biosynthesis